MTKINETKIFSLKNCFFPIHHKLQMHKLTNNKPFHVKK